MSGSGSFAPPDAALEEFVTRYLIHLVHLGYKPGAPTFAKTGLTAMFDILAKTGDTIRFSLKYAPQSKLYSFTTGLPPEKTPKLEALFFVVWAEISGTIPSDEGIHIYTDGSYKNTVCSYAFIVLQSKKIIFKESGTVPSEQTLGSYQVAGELRAVLRAAHFCQEKNFTSVVIHHDLAGAAHWAQGTYKAKAVISQLYREQLLAFNLHIVWKKEAAHTGVALNEYVDLLAKRVITEYEKHHPPVLPGEDNILMNTGKGFAEVCKEQGLILQAAGYFNGNANLKFAVHSGDTIHGFVNFYLKKGGAVSAAFHEIKNKEIRSTTELAWETFKQGQD